MKFNPHEFERISREIFSPIYPVIAKQILDETGVSLGKCLDVGSGPGSLGIEYAKLTDCKVDCVDINEEVLEYAKQNIIESGLEEEVSSCWGDVHSLPFDNDSYDLVISRGSLFFWDDKVKGINEIFRVLKKSGIAYIGGGFGNEALRRKIDMEFERQKDWIRRVKNRIGEDERLYYKSVLEMSIVKDFYIIDDYRGMWLVFSK